MFIAVVNIVLSQPNPALNRCAAKPACRNRRLPNVSLPRCTLRDWEQGCFAPPGDVLRLLKLIGNHPNLIGELHI